MLKRFSLLAIVGFGGLLAVACGGRSIPQGGSAAEYRCRHGDVGPDQRDASRQAACDEWERERAQATFAALDIRTARRKGIVYTLARDGADILVTTKTVDVCRDYTCKGATCRWLRTYDNPASSSSERARATAKEAGNVGPSSWKGISLYLPCPGATPVAAGGEPFEVQLRWGSHGDWSTAATSQTGPDGTVRVAGVAALAASFGQVVSSDMNLRLDAPAVLAKRTDEDLPTPDDPQSDKVVVAGGVMAGDVLSLDRGEAFEKKPISLTVYASNSPPRSIADWPKPLKLIACNESPNAAEWAKTRDCAGLLWDRSNPTLSNGCKQDNPVLCGSGDNTWCCPNAYPVCGGCGNSCCPNTQPGNAAPSVAAPASNNSACIAACQAQAEACSHRCLATQDQRPMNQDSLCYEQCSANRSTCWAACR